MTTALDHCLLHLIIVHCLWLLSIAVLPVCPPESTMLHSQVQEHHHHAGCGAGCVTLDEFCASSSCARVRDNLINLQSYPNPQYVLFSCDFLQSKIAIATNYATCYGVVSTCYGICYLLALTVIYPALKISGKCYFYFLVSPTPSFFMSKPYLSVSPQLSSPGLGPNTHLGIKCNSANSDTNTLLF